MLEQLALIICLQRSLIWRQRSTLRIEHQVQRQAAVRLPVTQRIKFLQCGDTLVERALAALFVHIVQRVTGQRGDDLDLLRGKKFGEIFLSRLEQNGEVTTVNHLTALRASGAHQITKALMQFRCAASQIECVHVARRQHLWN